MMKITGFFKANFLLLLILFTVATPLYSQNFHPDNIAIYRYGDGKPRNKTVPVFIDEYTPTGKLVRTIDVPFTPNQENSMLTGLPYTNTAIPVEGLMTLSDDNKYLTIIGYEQRLGQSTGNSDKSIGRIGIDGKINTSTVAIGDKGSPRCAVAYNDGFYLATTGTKDVPETAGLRYIPFGKKEESEGILAVNSQMMSAYIFLNKIYCTRGGDSFFSISSSLPISSKDKIREHKLRGSSKINQITMLDLDGNNIPDLLYAVDSENDGYLRKYTSKDGIKWDDMGSIDFLGISSNLRSITVKRKSASAIEVYIVSTGSFDGTVKSQLLKITDKPDSKISKETTVEAIVTAPSYIMFRSVALAPTKF